MNHDIYIVEVRALLDLGFTYRLRSEKLAWIGLSDCLRFHRVIF